ncbi:MAG TPA: hypothetical protein QF804_02600 [Rhodospirillales bacterium]|jgi:predicted metal-dependent enzyme (double-stranded beta helix superfamily)|nr:hypothetical protein [Rhodospirillales bacterium]HJO68551.1 hypothetical protein [Rhodospirillales bacterium]
MTYSLQSFVADSRRSVEADSGPEGLDAIRENLETLLADEAFLAAHFAVGAAPGKRTLHEDPQTGMCVLAHVIAPGGEGKPHDHGPAWAVYGQADRHTEMKERRRTDDGGVDGRATLEVVNAYRMEAGRAVVFGLGAIHSVHHPEGAWLVRVTGADLDRVVRSSYDTDGGTVHRSQPAD